MQSVLSKYCDMAKSIDNLENHYRVCTDPTKIEYSNAAGFFHREDGPALICNDGYKAWFINGQFHREDGPAIERANGDNSWYLNGHRIDCKTLEEFLIFKKLKAFW